LWRGLDHFALNANASFIDSKVTLQPQVSKLGSQEHPLQGQANYVLNGALNYAARPGGLDMTVLLTATGNRLVSVALGVLGDIYEEPSASLDATLSFPIFGGLREKMSARNLLDPTIRQLQQGHEVSSYRRGRSFAITVSYD
jgi:hypothetical protein